jgi:mannose/cellobiose epimerase-like protein (N-acyl-D-glucosamine 2-epimerase family)
LPGHFVEWTKLLLILERHRPEDWMLARARCFFDTAMERAWDHERGGMHYTFSPEGEIMDTDRYYWVLAEIIASSAALALRTGDERYWDWYDQAWAYTDVHFVDHQHGAWYRVLDLTGERYDNRKSPPSKTDYHPLSACYEVLRSLRRED